MRCTVAFRRFILLLLCLSPTLAAQNFPNGFPFTLPADDSTRQAFLPDFPADPIPVNGFVAVDGNGHFAVNGERVRFFGVNVVADGAFPGTGDADIIARRMAKMGINLVRFHHMDNPWSAGSLFQQGSDTRHLNPVTLNRFERLVAALKANGIHANINLHVSRTFAPGDGIPDVDSLPEFGKAINFFDPQVVALHKEFATQLLTHVNPHTGLPLTDDPVMAMVEITNENSLYLFWRNDELRHFSEGGVLTRRHAAMLDSQWIDFLRARYPDTDSLRAAWERGAGGGGTGEQIVDGGFENDPITANWILEQHGSAAATMAIDTINAFNGARCARLAVSAVDGTDWHLQWKHTGISLEQDSLYRVAFAARSATSRDLPVSVMLDVDPYTGFASRTVALTPQWQTFDMTFRAPQDVGGTGRLSFTLGSDTGTVWVDAVHLTRAVRSGLDADESLENGTVRRIRFSEAAGRTPQRVRDMSAFYFDRQNRYYAAMSSFLKDSLGVRVPVSGTNWNFGIPDLAVQSHPDLDYLDNHAYWDHPSFPNEPWSPTDWLITNTPMVDNPAGGTPTRLFGGVGAMGRPLTVSEYNHAFPNRYQSEGMLFLTVYGAFHDADAVMLFDYNGSTDWRTDRVSGFFSIHRNTAMMALMPSVARAFREGFVQADPNPLPLAWGRDDLLLYPQLHGHIWDPAAGWPATLALRHALRTTTFDAENRFDPATLPPAPQPPYTTVTNEIRWDPAGSLTVVSDRFVGVTGMLDRFARVDAGPLTVINGDDFATLTWLSLSDDPVVRAPRTLLTLSTAVQNTGMVWDGNRTVHDDWGSAPTEMRPARLVVQLAVPADSLVLHVLDPVGAPTGQRLVYGPAAPGLFLMLLDQQARPSVWYGLEAVGLSTGVDPSEESAPVGFGLDPAWPNPFNGGTQFEYRLTAPGRATLEIFNLLGERVRTLVDGRLAAGRHEARWDGRDAHGAGVSSGVYLVALTAGERREIRRVVYLK